MRERTSHVLSAAAVAAIALVYLHNTLPYLTMLPRINVDEPWLIERAYMLATTGAPSQPMFLLDRGYLLQPGYSILLAPWIELFGVGLLETRVLAVLCGAAALLAVFSLGRQLFGLAVGLVAVLFLATDSNFLGVVRMARTDAPAVMFAAAGLAMGLRGLRRGSARDALLGGLATGFAVLCHANSYWVGVIVFIWYAMAYGWRLVLTPSAYAYGAGVMLMVGPYLAIVLMNLQEFREQLDNFAIERVPGMSPATIWFHITQEPLRYRDWYFGLITNDVPNLVLRLFQASTAAGTLYLLWRLYVGRRAAHHAAPERILAVLVFGSAIIFAAFIPNKALVYLPHLLIGLSLMAALFVVRTLQSLPAIPPAGRLSVHPAVASFVLVLGTLAVWLYQNWYGLMHATELRPYEHTHAVVEAMVPPGPKYLVASPTFWLPFHADREVRFVSYTGAGPYERDDPRIASTDAKSLLDLSRDRPLYMLLDDVEFRAVLDDPAYDRWWRDTWIRFIRAACAPSRVAFGTAHGTLALYRCSWDNRPPPAITPRFVYEGTEYARGGIAWSASPEEMRSWQLYRPSTALTVSDDALQVVAPEGGGVWTDVPVTAGSLYLLDADVTGAKPSDLMSVHSIGENGLPVHSRWLKLASNDWFPTGHVVRPTTSTLRIYLYSETAMSVAVRSVELIHLTDERLAPRQ